MNINWQEIKEKYPVAFELYELWVCSPHSCKKNECQNCYDDLEKFFDDNGIIISIDFLCYMKKGKFSFTISNNDEQLFLQEKMLYTRQETKEQAIPKAFEILENKLRGDKND